MAVARECFAVGEGLMSLMCRLTLNYEVGSIGGGKQAAAKKPSTTMSLARRQELPRSHLPSGARGYVNQAVRAETPAAGITDEDKVG